MTRDGGKTRPLPTGSLNFASWRASAGQTWQTRRLRFTRFGAAVRRLRKPCTWWG